MYNDGDSSIYRLINNSLIDQMNSDSLASLIKKYFSGSQFETDLATVINDRGYVDEYTDLYEGDSLLTYEDDFAQTVLEKFCDYYSSSTDRNNMRSLLLTNRKSELLDMIDPACTGLDVTDWMVAVLSNDNTSNTFLTALNSLDAMRFDMVYQACGGLPSPPFPPATLAAKIAQIRSNPDAVAANNIKNFFGPSDIEPIIQGLGSTLQDNAINSLDFCNLMSSLSGSCYGSTWFDFVYDYVDEDIVKNIVINESDGFYLADLLLTNDRRSLNKIAANFPDLISDVLRNTEDLDFSTYLFYIYKKFGRTVFNQVLDDVGTITLQKTLTLDELHIYGSSRHGIKKPKTRLVAKIYELDEIKSDGEFTYGAGSDSTFAKINYHYFKRTLTYKQYELTNHLGNVLATIMDRKTPQISSGNVSYYEADVTTAQMYYAFGSAIKELTYAYSSDTDTSRYRYGFNGMERDNETTVDGGSYDFGARIYDSRLGRWLSLDPLQYKYSNISAYNFSCNDPIFFVDGDGQKIVPWYYCGKQYKYWGEEKLQGFDNFEYELGLKVVGAIELMYYQTNSIDIFKQAYDRVKASNDYCTFTGYSSYDEYESGRKTGGYFDDIHYKGTMSDPFLIVIHDKPKEAANDPNYFAAVIFEEVFHAAQADYYKQIGKTISPINTEVEAKLAKLISGIISNYYSYENDIMMKSPKFAAIVETLKNKGKLTPEETNMFKRVIMRYAVDIAAVYGTENGLPVAGSQISDFKIEDMLYLQSLIGIDFSIPPPVLKGHITINTHKLQ